MAAQSFAMGEAFGKGFQYGKRRVSSMTNAEFNSKTAVNHFEETTADINGMIPAMKAQMSTFALLQSDIIQEMIGYIKKLPADVASGLDLSGLAKLLGGGSTETAGTGDSKVFQTVFGVGNAGAGAKAFANFTAKDYEVLIDKIITGVAGAADVAAKIITGRPVGGALDPSKPANRVTVTVGRDGQKQYSIDPKYAPSTGFIPSTPRTYTSTVVKPRAPTSICTQRKKYLEEVRAWDYKNQLANSRNQQGQVQRNNVQKYAVLAKINAINAKWDMSACR